RERCGRSGRGLQQPTRPPAASWTAGAARGPVWSRSVAGAIVGSWTAGARRTTTWAPSVRTCGAGAKTLRLTTRARMANSPVNRSYGQPVRVVRSAFSPPGHIVVADPTRLEGFEDEVKTWILPPETSDEVLAQAEQMVEAHNRFLRDMETL